MRVVWHLGMKRVIVTVARRTAVIVQGMWVDGTELEQKYISDARQKGVAELSFLFPPLRENSVPVILIGLRDRFLTLAPAII